MMARNDPWRGAAGGRRRNRPWLAALAALGLWQAVGLAAARADSQQYARDLAELTRHPHRLAGSEFGRQAGDHILRRLEALGVADVFVLDMPVPQVRTLQCQLTVGAATVDLLPLRPNLVAPPTTPAAGLTGPLLYAGYGELKDYGQRNPRGAIVVLDYECADNWERAFALGAQAVIFLGGPRDHSVYVKHTGVPANLVRLYAPPGARQRLDLTRDQPSATVVSRVVWENATGRNILAYLPGADPSFKDGPLSGWPEMIVLSAHYDSFGQVPELSPGARGAANVAALLQAVEYFQAQRPRRDVLFMFLDNQARFHQGGRYVYDALMRDSVGRNGRIEARDTNLAREHTQEQSFLSSMRALLQDDPRQMSRLSGAAAAGVPGYVVAAAVLLATVLLLAVVWAVRRAWLASRTLGVLAVAVLAVLGIGALSLVAILGRTSSPTEGPRSAVFDELVRRLQNQTDMMRADVNQTLLEARIARARARDPQQKTRLQADVAARQKRVEAWDQLRRALHNRRLTDAEPELFRELAQAVRTKLDRRLTELEEAIRMDRQRAALLQKLNGRWISLHLALDFADAGPTWSVVVGEWSERVYFSPPNTGGDTPGHYNRVMGAFRQAQAGAKLGPDSGLALAALAGQPGETSRFVPGKFVNSSYAAGLYGVYNLSLMTDFDRRLRDGHPSDTPALLDAGRVLRQWEQARGLVKAVADGPDLSLSRVFQALATSKRPGWSGDRPSGDRVGVQLTGSLSEDRPAAGAVLALLPRTGNAAKQDWSFMRDPISLPDYEAVFYERVDSNGRFPIVAARRDALFNTLLAVGALFDEQGNVNAMTAQEKLRVAQLGSVLQISLFPAHGGVVVYRLIERPVAGTFKVLNAAANAVARPSRTLYGQMDNIGFFYQSSLLPPEPVKFFQPKGPVLLGVNPQAAYGEGVMSTALATPPDIDQHAAHDLWSLNELRLQSVRSRGVTDAALESLHARAQQALEDAQRTPSLEERSALLKQSTALSRAVYTPLRQSMDDLVTAIVILLLLAIPFSFAVERLLFAATTIYRRLAGFAVVFLATFLLLFFMHPGFAIASTPVIIFLAFTILLLASLVIYIIVRKFRTELRAMQGQGVGLHHLEISRLGTLLAAVNMGMSTMRRRPTRTALTAITVVMLTFTILCFASVTTRMGLRVIGEGAASEEVAAAVMVRHLNYKELPPELLTQLSGLEGRGGLLASQWWLVQAKPSDDPFSVARPDDGSAAWLEGMMGLQPRELERWPQLAAVLGGGDLQTKIAALGANGVFLPAIVQEKLRLKVGDPVLYHGEKAVFAGAVDATALQRLVQLDSRTVLPVNLLDASSAMAESGISGEQATALDEQVERDFVHLSPDQVAVASAHFVRRLGGDLRVVNLYPGPDVDAANRGREIAQMVTVPVWARTPRGVERLVFTKLTEVAGGLALAVPVLLGGLIIFGTLLGSISDREKEIYTFSALGLAPKHVGFLFFAEASVYAVVGGMVGQILAQAVALIAPHVARALDLGAPSINYSSTNSLFAIGLVMATVLVSAIYPALRASRSANPGLARSWKMPRPVGDDIQMTFPFTVSAYDITGVVSFLAEHFKAHNDAGLGSFAAQDVAIQRETASGNLSISARLALAPFDLGVTQELSLTAKPSEIPGVDEVAIHVHRTSGAVGDWYRANRVFVQDLRRQFLLWRTLTADMIETYRLETLQVLGENGNAKP